MTKLSEKKGGGLIYNPPRMLFDGSTGYYNGSYTSSGNLFSILARFSLTSFSGGGVKCLGICVGPSGYMRAKISAFANDHATPAIRDTVAVQVQNSSGATIAFLLSPVGYLDGSPHCLSFGFNGTTGAATYIIDSTNADDTGNASRQAPTAGTLDSGASTLFFVGRSSTAAQYWSGEIGFCGIRDAHLTNWSDYMDQYGNPKQTDFSGWLFGHFAGKMDENEGSAGAMTKNGTIVVGDGGAM